MLINTPFQRPITYLGDMLLTIFDILKFILVSEAWGNKAKEIERLRMNK